MNVTTEELQNSNEAAPSGDLCSVCGQDLRQGIHRSVDGLAACDSCADRVELFVKAEQPAPNALPRALVVGAFGALIAAVLWALIAVVTGYELGLIALAVGYFAGLGVRVGAGNAASMFLQVAAAGLALFGVLAAKYMLVAYSWREAAMAKGITLSYFSEDILTAFPEVLLETFTPYDGLWIFIAVTTAYKLPAPIETRRVD